MRRYSSKNVFSFFRVFLGAAFFSTVVFIASAPGLRSPLPVPGDQQPADFVDLATRLSPAENGRTYITVNVAAGRICLRTADTVLLDAPCSAGSGAKLRDPQTGRVWSFTTPSGVFRIRAKAENPIWNKPDWAYLEKGLPLPENPDLRLTADELGGYSLNLGGGLFIHGTVYTRLLGMNVTHGCIRVGDEALAQIYEAVEIGTPVYIFNTGGDPAESNTGQVLAVNLGSHEFRLLMDGEVVWEASFAGEIIEGGYTPMPQTVIARHMYTGKGEYQDRELAVAADELGIQPEMLQRIYPGRFAIMLDDGNTLEVTADIDAAPFSRWNNACFDLLRFIDAPFSERCQKLTVSAADATVIYNFARPGLPLSIRQGHLE